jgi:tetratricopeptide (TPR) repeat protein
MRLHALLVATGLAVTIHAVALAAPTTSRGAPLAESSVTADERPANRAFRAGLEAQVRGDLATARAHFELALKADPAFVPAMLGMAGIELAQKNVAAAEAFLQRAEKAGPNAPEVALGRGRMQLARNDLAGAEKAFRKSIALGPKTLPPRIELGDLYLRMGRPRDALEAFRAAAGIDGRNKYVAYGLGAAAAAAGQRDEAVRAFKVAAEVAPQEAAPWRMLGRLHLEAGAVDDALTAFDTGLERQPKHVPTMLDRAAALARKQRVPDAIKQGLAAEQIAPDSYEVRLQLGDLMQAAKQWNDAEARYTRAIELQPKSPFAYNNLAWMIVARNGDARKAVSLAEQAVSLAPNAPPFLDTLGWARRAAGDLPGAAAKLEEAVKAAPRGAIYHYHLGVVQAERKLPDAARAALKTALSLELPAAEAAEAKRLLDALGR